MVEFERNVFQQGHTARAESAIDQPLQRPPSANGSINSFHSLPATPTAIARAGPPTSASVVGKEGMELRKEMVHTTLIRDSQGLGFSIAGGKGSPGFIEGSDVSVPEVKLNSIFIFSGHW